MTDDEVHADQQIDHLLRVLRHVSWSVPLTEEVQRLAEQLRARLPAGRQDKPEGQSH